MTQRPHYAVEKTDFALRELENINEQKHFCTRIHRASALAIAQEQDNQQHSTKSAPLHGLFLTVKENIWVKDYETTASSAILRGFVPSEDATVVDRCKKAGAIVLAQTVCDEFGFGSFSTNVGKGFQIPLHPLDDSRVTGGSSGGAAGVTASVSFPHVALATSTGGSIECPAAWCGVIGFVPSWGAVSRWGLIPYAHSLDKIGLMSTSLADIGKVFSVMSGTDSHDPTSAVTLAPLKTYRRIGYVKESIGAGTDPAIKKQFMTTISLLKSKGYDVQEISLPLTYAIAVPTYYIIATAEASTNLASLCGLRYGVTDDPKGKDFTSYFTEIRSKSFGPEALRRILLGTFVRTAGYHDAFYGKACQLREAIIAEYAKQFEHVDVLLTPTMPCVAPKRTETSKLRPDEQFMMDILTVGPSLAGLPHATIPMRPSHTATDSSQSLPFGIMATAAYADDTSLLAWLTVLAETQDQGDDE